MANSIDKKKDIDGSDDVAFDNGIKLPMSKKSCGCGGKEEKFISIELVVPEVDLSQQASGCG